MTWTTDKPTKPGWYWWRSEEDKKARAVEIYDNGNGGALWVSVSVGLCESALTNFDGEWAGPIEVPE